MTGLVLGITALIGVGLACVALVVAVTLWFAGAL